MSCTVVKYNVDTPILEAKIHRYIKRILFQLVVAHFYSKAIAITRFDSHVIFSNIFESRGKNFSEKTIYNSNRTIKAFI